MSLARVGFIGLGQVAELHLTGCRESGLIEVVAGAETDPARLEQMSAKWGFKGYLDFKEMLRQERPDIACICTPPSSHHDITLRAAELGVNVLCEKPMALSVADAGEMIKACQQAGVKFYYGSSYRCLPPCLKAKEMIEQGLVGQVRLMLETSIGGAGAEKWQDLGAHHYPPGGPGGGGMGLIDHGIHLIDIFAWLTNGRVKAVFGRGNVSGEGPVTEYVTMIFENGAVGQLVYDDATFPARRPFEGIFSQGASWDPGGRLLPGGGWDPEPQCIQVHGTKGALLVYHYANKLYFSDASGMRQIPLQGRTNPGHFGTQLENFAQSLAKKEEPPVTGHDGLKALQVALAVYESHRTGALVSIPEL
ncbi:MAG: Gfo/Idh/MocA family oxidoreductase [Deltaproteobacteria bacterium]|nr:Gfo/Idh/MocA family oxidoreductase [Deltaproteobacteria bacterium]